MPENDWDELNRAMKRLTCKMNRLLTPAFNNLNDALTKLSKLSRTDWGIRP